MSGLNPPIVYPPFRRVKSGKPQAGNDTTEGIAALVIFGLMAATLVATQVQYKRYVRMYGD